MDDRIDPRRMGAAIRKRWWLLLLLSSLALLGASKLTGELPVAFRSRTSVLVGDALGNAQVGKDDFETSEDLAVILAPVLRERPVLRGVIEELHLTTTWTELSGRIRASVTGGNRHLIVVTVEAPSAEEAIAIARQIPEQLKLFISDDRASSATSHVRAFMWARVRAAERHILSAESVIEKMRKLARVETAPAVLDGLSGEIGDTETVVIRWQQAHTATFGFLSKFGSPARLKVIDPADAYTERLAPDPFLVTGLSEASALLIGLMLIYGLEARKRPWRALASPDPPHGRPPSVEVGAQTETPRLSPSGSSPLEEGGDRAGS